MYRTSLKLWGVLLLAVLSWGSTRVLGSVHYRILSDKYASVNSGVSFLVSSPESSRGLDDRRLGDSTSEDSVGKQKPLVGKQKPLKVERVERIGAFSADTLETKYGFVRFEQGKGRYGFDLGAEKWYQKTTILDAFYKPFGKGYIAPWKLIPVGEQDEVIAKYGGRNISNLAKVRFASAPNSSAIPAEFDESTKTWKLSLPATDANSSYEVFALYEGKVIGKLRVVSYPKQSYKLRLVPVNGQSVGDVSRLSQQLNDIYNKYGVSFTLYEGEGMTATFSSANLKSELKELNKQYKQTHTLTSEDVCIFVVSEELSRGSKYEEVEGLMQRGKRFGYIFAGNSPNEDKLARTLTHELGHGLFTLGHTFDSDYNKGKRGATNNLMDYTGKEATELAAYQWNIMANPAPFTGTDKKKDAQLLKKGAIWLTPEWQPFVYDESNQISTSDDETIPNGSISGIALHSHSKKVYTYNKQTHRYEYKDGMGMDTLAIKYVLQINEEDIVHLLDRKSGVAGVVYSAKWKDIKHSISDSTLFLSSAVNFVREVASNQFVEHPEIHVQYTARYICDEIKKNIGTFEVSVMKATNSVATNNMAHNPIRGEQPTLLPKMFGNAFSYFVWTLKVMPKGDWEHKRKIKELQAADYCCDKRFIHPMQFKFDLWSNIHYGFIGAYAGFTEFELISGAGLVQIFTNPKEQLDENIKINQQIFPIPANKLVAQYDDPSDQQAILIGIRLFKKFENRIHDLSPNDILREIYNVYQQGLPISVKQCDKH